MTGANVPVAAHPFSTTETHVGIAQVPDPRLRALAEMSKSKKVVGATLEFVDIAGLVAGSSTGEGMGNRFLGGIREVDAIVMVLRAFVDDNVVGGTDPLDDLHTLELELVLADVDSVETQIVKRRKMARNDPALKGEVEAMEAALESLNAGIPIYRSSLNAGAAPGPALHVPPHQQAGAGRGQPGRGPGGRRRRVDEAGGRRAGRCRRGARGQRPARGRGRVARRGRPGRAARGARPGRGGTAPGRSAPPTSSWAGGRSSRRATRSRGRGRSGPAPRRPSAPA